MCCSERAADTDVLLCERGRVSSISLEPFLERFGTFDRFMVFYLMKRSSSLSYREVANDDCVEFDECERDKELIM